MLTLLPYDTTKLFLYSYVINGIMKVFNCMIATGLCKMFKQCNLQHYCSFLYRYCILHFAIFLIEYISSLSLSLFRVRQNLLADFYRFTKPIALKGTQKIFATLRMNNMIFVTTFCGRCILSVRIPHPCVHAHFNQPPYDGMSPSGMSLAIVETKSGCEDRQRDEFVEGNGALYVVMVTSFSLMQVFEQLRIYKFELLRVSLGFYCVTTLNYLRGTNQYKQVYST